MLVLLLSVLVGVATGQRYTDNSSIPIPALPQGQKPNFFVILTDDQGWDDIGVNNPRYVHTPNIDKFIRQGTFFDNYYTAPQCAQTRAQLLIGRSYVRTGTILTNSCADFIHSDEVTMGAVMTQAGYHTAQFGKWHNLDVLGYEPWNVGFQESYIPKAAPGASLMRVNGRYTSITNPLYPEEALAEVVLDYLDRMAKQLQESSPAQPFLLYYSPHLIHAYAEKDAEGSVNGRARLVPPELGQKYHNNTKYAGIPSATLDAWATLEYLDLLLGKLWNYIQASPQLCNTTYIMIQGDNGSALLGDEGRGRNRKYRMPSQMKGSKSTLSEGGIRNWLAVRGPGISAGVSDSTMLEVADILPTLVDLAGVQADSVDHLPWDGLSFRNLLHAPRCKANCSSNSSNVLTAAGFESADSAAASEAPESAAIYAPDAQNSSGAANTDGNRSYEFGPDTTIIGTRYNPGVRRGTALATQQQLNRFLVVLGPACWDSDLVLALNADREIRRPQLLLDYAYGGQNYSNGGLEPEHEITPEQHQPFSLGFKKCLVVRHKEYKWIGAEGKVYRLDSHHWEGHSNVVQGDEGKQLNRLLSRVARDWWKQMVMEPHSFARPVYYLGLGNWTVTNMLTCGAFQRTEGSVKLMRLGATGFKNPGDQMCFNVKVLQEGNYDAAIFYVSSHVATFQLAVGTWHDILAGTAAAVAATLLPSSTLTGYSMGRLAIPATTAGGAKLQACLQLMNNSRPGEPVFENLANIRMTRIFESFTGGNPKRPRPRLPHVFSSTVVQTTDSIGTASELTANGLTDVSTTSAFVAPLAAGVDVCGKHSWLLSTAQNLVNQSKRASPSRIVAVSSTTTSSMCSRGMAWQQLRRAHGWPDGQSEFESMFAPYNTEDIADCEMCKPPI